MVGSLFFGESVFQCFSLVHHAGVALRGDFYHNLHYCLELGADDMISPDFSSKMSSGASPTKYLDNAFGMMFFNPGMCLILNLNGSVFSSRSLRREFGMSFSDLSLKILRRGLWLVYTIRFEQPRVQLPMSVTIG